jgi:hypothetical protein
VTQKEKDRMTDRTKWTGAWHPLAERFPMLPEDELREMASSITAHGQFVPCRMSPEGVGLDGRNRVAACKLADIEPQWEVYDGDLIAFIVEVNGDRRHLTTGQRAMATAIGLVEVGKRQNGRFKPGTVPENGGSSGLGWRLADPVLRGGITLDAAHKEADARRKQHDRLVALGGDLAKLVDSQVITLDEAERRLRDGERLEKLGDAELVQRVNDGRLSLDEAETIRAENLRRVATWAQEVEHAYDVLQRMAGHPIPGDLNTRLSKPVAIALPSVLAAFTPPEDPT